jgi:hypothetical protein
MEKRWTKNRHRYAVLRLRKVSCKLWLKYIRNTVHVMQELLEQEMMCDVTLSTEVRFIVAINIFLEFLKM